MIRLIEKSVAISSVVLAAALVPIDSSGTGLRVAKAYCEPSQHCTESPSDFCYYIGGPNCEVAMTPCPASSQGYIHARNN